MNTFGRSRATGMPLSGGRTAPGSRTKDSALLGLVVALLGIPIFLMVTPAGGVSLPAGTSVAARTGEISVPLSVFLVSVGIALTASYRSDKRNPMLAGVCLAVFVFVNFLAFVIGSLVNGFSFLSLAFLIQTFLPVLGFVLGRRIGRLDSEWISRVVWRMAVVILVSYLCVALTTLIAGGRPWVYVGESIGPLPIPQARRYMPTVVAFALIVYCRAKLLDRVTPLKALGATVILMLLLASHSRTALVVLAAGVFWFVVWDFRSLIRQRTNLAVLVVLFVGLLGASWNSINFEDAPQALARFSSHDAAATLSSERRADALIGSISETMTTPLGRMYSASEDETLGGVEASYARVSNAENQVGEYGLRAGPLALLAVVLAIGSILMRSRRALACSSGIDQQLAPLWLGTCAAITGSVLTQQSLSQPYTGIILWFGLGVLYAVVDNHSREIIR